MVRVVEVLADGCRRVVQRNYVEEAEERVRSLRVSRVENAIERRHHRRLLRTMRPL